MASVAPSSTSGAPSGQKVRGVAPQTDPQLDLGELDSPLSLGKQWGVGRSLWESISNWPSADSMEAEPPIADQPTALLPDENPAESFRPSLNANESPLRTDLPAVEGDAADSRISP
jgi:hypothetical protein